MILGIITLLIAVVISIVSAYYSILGLTAIFASAVIPVMIMGGSLEAGKVITAVWLHANWKRAELQYKLYLVPAVIFLMVLTSMGVFGFLSKAHSDQSLVSGDSMAKVAIYDEKIKTAKENIDANRRALKQMDEAVDQVMGRSSDEKGAEKAVAIRRGQTKERTRLLSEITAEQKVIAQLSEERAPVAAEVRQVEAEVGPIKYIAALIYGDNPDTTVLERAVRWVIILIVSVFDPLAIVLILAGIKQIEWSKEDKSESSYEPTGSAAASGVTIDDMIAEEQPAPVILPDPEPDLSAVNAELAELAEDKEIVEPEIIVDTTAEEINSIRQELDRLHDEAQVHTQEHIELYNKHTELTEEYNAALEREQILAAELEKALEQKNIQINELIPVEVQDRLENGEHVSITELPELQELVKKGLEDGSIVIQGAADPEQEYYEEPKILAMGLDVVDRPGDYVTPPLEPIPDNQPRSDFGVDFPGSPEKGDMFLRTDFKPSRLFKWNDYKWIEVNKNVTDAYSYNEAYIQFLADKIYSGEYSLDDLTEIELQQVQILLSKQNG